VTASEISYQRDNLLKGRLFFLPTVPELLLRTGESRESPVQRRDPPFPLLFGDRLGTGEDGEWGLRCLVYIVPIVGLLCRDGERSVETTSPLTNKFLRSLLHLAGVRVGCGEGLVCCILTGSGDSLEALDLIGEFFCPSFIFFGDGTGEDALSVEVLGRYGYHYPEESGRWFAFPPFWWFASPFGCSSRRRVGVDVAWRQTPASPAKRWPSAIFLGPYVQ